MLGKVLSGTIWAEAFVPIPIDKKKATDKADTYPLLPVGCFSPKQVAWLNIWYFIISFED
ncbi:MAG: hypothetical protein QNJ41_13780 [Xenococcaceae cyanobacterium MO_188.B32]|nr:hypothetical protein [Xenococcaceae cyanobacterium MO_188.B32]